MKISIKYGLLLLLLCFTANAQTVKQEKPQNEDIKQEGKEWVQIETENKEVSFSIPDNYSFFFDADGYNTYSETNVRKKLEYRNLRSITAHENGVTMWLESYDVRDLENAFREFLPNHTTDNDKVNSFKIGDYSLIAITSNNEHSTRHFYYFHSDKRVYFMGIGYTNPENPALKKFLNSFNFKEKNLFNSNDTVTQIILKPLKTMSWETMKTSEIDIKYNIKPKKSKETKTKKDQSKNASASIDNKQIPVDKDENKVGIIILTKPKPGYTDRARRKNTKGILRLKLVFRSNGLIQSIEVIKELKNGLTERAINAARRIAFLPPTRNGVPYSVAKPVIYNFDIY